jgi:hypothetical protein
VSIDLWALIGRQTDLQLPLIDSPFPLLLPDFFMRWVRLRLGRPCPDNGSVSLMVRGCSPGFGFGRKSGELVAPGRPRQTRRLAIGHLVQKGAPGRSCWARVGVGRRAANFVRGTLVHHYRAVLAWCAKIFCPIASGYRGIDLPEI